MSLSNPYRYATDNNYSVYTSIVGLTDSTYLLLYFDSFESNSSSSDPAGGSGALTVLLATISTTTMDISFSTPSTLTNSQLSLSFTASRLDNTSAVVAYADKTTNYGVTTQLVRLIQEDGNGQQSTSIGSLVAVHLCYYYLLFNVLTPSILSSTNVYICGTVFGSSLSLSKGQSLAYIAPYGVMDLDLLTTSAAGDFTVLFSDVSNQGTITLASAKVCYTSGVGKA